MPPRIGDYIFDLLGRAAPVVEIPEAQHHVMLDQPLALVAALRALAGRLGTFCRNPASGLNCPLPGGFGLLYCRLFSRANPNGRP